MLPAQCSLLLLLRNWVNKALVRTPWSLVFSSASTINPRLPLDTQKHGTLILSHLDITTGAPLSLLELSRKLVTLVALCSLLRTCEISSILFDSIEISDSRVSFTLGLGSREKANMKVLSTVYPSKPTLRTSPFVPSNVWRSILIVRPGYASPRFLPLSFSAQTNHTAQPLWPRSAAGSRNNFRRPVSTRRSSALTLQEALPHPKLLPLECQFSRS